MKAVNPKQVVLQFNECINQQDIEGLAELMSADHVFIDSGDEVQRGKEMMVQGWQEFFRHYPDYRNRFETIKVRGSEVAIRGYSTCSFEALHGPALWSAKVRDGLVAEWRVYLDTAENRKLLGL